eukprot:TRINITY_DN18384_c0_g1_i1.p1 TRINITY_DN18384_c0_g1~~TRINITY_DN18384_c0_g1_i1.p1  ORF type:complete len:712 (+),score=174.16 TRINITY_DN18384_c0_g1_i1:398-2533(+)
MGQQLSCLSSPCAAQEGKPESGDACCRGRCAGRCGGSGEREGDAQGEVLVTTVSLPASLPLDSLPKTGASTELVYDRLDKSEGSRLCYSRWDCKDLWKEAELEEVVNSDDNGKASFDLGMKSEGDVFEDAQSCQRYNSRDAFAAVLDAGDVTLVRGSWLVKLDEGGFEGYDSVNTDGEVRRVLPRCQDLPPEAVCPSKEAQELPIIAISHCWWAPDHPDPHGDQLHVLAKVLKQRTCWQDEEVAVFLDWCSLPQQPWRRPEEEATFQRGLRSADLWFAHREVSVWTLSKVPWGARNYAERGWPTFETLAASMPRVRGRLLDLSRLDESCTDWPSTSKRCGPRRKLRPPPTPEAFSSLLGRKVFRAESDRLEVTEMYKRLFAETVGYASKLDFKAMAWDDDDMDALSRTLLVCGRLQDVDLSDNHIGDGGADALASALPRCSRLRTLRLANNEIGDLGARHVATCLPRCPRLGKLLLAGNAISDAGAAALAATLPSCSRLLEVLLAQNEIGDNGARSLAEAFPRCPALRCVDLSENEIGDGGAARLAEALPNCQHLRRLDLARNRLGDTGAGAFAAVLPRCRKVHSLGFGGSEIGEILGGSRICDEGASALAAALVRCSRLQRLDLGGNVIGSCGAEQIATVLPRLGSLTELDLSGNVVGVAGAASLAAALPSCSRLLRLHLSGKAMGEDGWKQLREAWLLAGRPEEGLCDR